MLEKSDLAENGNLKAKFLSPQLEERKPLENMQKIDPVEDLEFSYNMELNILIATAVNVSDKSDLVKTNNLKSKLLFPHLGERKTPENPQEIYPVTDLEFSYKKILSTLIAPSVNVSKKNDLTGIVASSGIRKKREQISSNSKNFYQRDTLLGNHFNILPSSLLLNGTKSFTSSPKLWIDQHVMPVTTDHDNRCDSIRSVGPPRKRFKDMYSYTRNKIVSEGIPNDTYI